MNNGTNDYNASKLTPSEEIVSRTLQAKNRSFLNVIWRTGKPALDSEWNLLNDVASELFYNSIQSSAPSGWLSLGANKYATNSGIENTFSFFSQENEQEVIHANAYVNGFPVLVGGVSFSDMTTNQITLLPAGSTERYDFVFLEVWKAQIRTESSQGKPSEESIYKFGNVQSNASTNLPDDMIDPVFNEETSERVQIQYRIRSVSNVVFANTDSKGFDSALVQAQGGGTTPQTSSYSFINMSFELGDVGLWRAGNGDQASQSDLKSVDGYTYAIPMFKIHRRSTTAYSDTGGDQVSALYNQTGNSAVLTTVTRSDRPDRKFNDGIDATDIIDLRNKISLSGWNYQKIMEENLDKLLKGELKSNRIQELSYESISDIDVFGYTDFLNNAGASGKRTFWSDAVTQQSNIFAEVKTTTLSTALDVFRGTGSSGSPWGVGNSIVIKTISRLPSGTIIKSTPRLYLEDSLKTPIVGGAWSGLDTNQAIYTLPTGSWIGTNYDIWVYYDIDISSNQGLTYVPDELLRVTYTNASVFPNGVVVRGSRIKTEEINFQDLFEHPFENKDATEVYTETSLTKQRKQIKISPLIQTTTSRNGSIRTLEVETLNKTAKTVNVPFPLQHLRGVYTSASAGTEIAMQQVVTRIQVSGLEIDDNKIMISEDNFIGTITSLQYIPSGLGSEVELLGYNYLGSPLNYVLEHRVITGDIVGTRISLYNSDNIAWPIPVTATASQFKWAGTRTRVRQSSGYGYDLGGYVIDCTGSYNASYITSMADRQQVWIDCDYLGAPHIGADIRMIYSHTPYQGSSVGSQELSLVYKREKGIFFNNGTGGGTINITGSTGASNSFYTPVSPRLPGTQDDDHLKNGAPIEIRSSGQKKFASDLWATASYDLYGYHGGGKLWADNYVMPAMPSTSLRGFFEAAPMLEVIFEEPIVDATKADFALPILVRNKASGELYLMIQTGNKGVHVNGTTTTAIYVDIFCLNERIITI